MYFCGAFVIPRKPIALKRRLFINPQVRYTSRGDSLDVSQVICIPVDITHH